MPTNENLPVTTLAEALSHLRRPVPPEAIRFKVQSESDRAGLVVSYIDSRIVYERLNQVVGERWSHDFRPLADGPRPDVIGGDGASPVFVICRLTVCGVTHEDVGEGRDPKAAFSDAVKRAAVPFGIGRFLYAMRTPWMREGARDSELRRGGAKRRLFVDERSQRWLRDQYGRWLARAGDEFGEPLAQADGAGQQSEQLADVVAVESNVAARPAPDVTSNAEPVADIRPNGRGVLDAQMTRGGFSETTVAALIAVLYDGAAVLNPRQYTELGTLLDDAAGGGIGDRTLAEAVARCARRGDGAESLVAWVAERAERSRAA